MTEDKKQRSVRITMGATLFGLIALMLIVWGYWYYQQEAGRIRTQAYNELKAIAELKTNQILEWRNEKISDLRLNTGSFILKNWIAQWLKDPGNAALPKDLMARLQFMKNSGKFQNVILAGLDGRILLTLDPRLTELEVPAKQLIADTVSSRKVLFGSLFRCSTRRQIHLDLAGPILNRSEKPIAVLILRIDPQTFLYPLIQSWPIPSKTAETVLVRKEGNKVLFLNALRHKADPALTIRIPLSSGKVPAVQAVQGKTGLFEGLDYRDIPVLADIRAIPDSPWYMVAKVDKKEILSQAAERARSITILTLVLILLSGASIAFFYKHKGKRIFQALYQVEREKADLLEEARVTLYSIGDAVITTDAQGRVRRMNQVAEKLTGWKEAEAVDKPLPEIFHIVNEATRTAVDSPVEHVFRQGTVIGLANHTLLISRNGQEYPIADSGAPIRNGRQEIIGVVLVFRDQTEERKNQAVMEALTYRQDALLAAIPDIIMEVDENKIYTWTNQAGYEFFGKDVIGKEAAFYFEGDQNTYETVQPLFDGDEDLIYVESWQRRRDGKKRLLAWWCRILKDEKKEIKGVLSSARDITEHREGEEKIRASLLEKEILLQEIHHRVKNNLQVVKSLLGIQSRMIDDPVSRAAFQESQERVQTMAMVHEKLYQSPDLASLQMKEYLRELGIDLMQSHRTDHNRIRISFQVEEVLVGMGQAIPLGLILNELISNALKYAFPGKKQGEIQVGLKQIDGGSIEVRVKDNGIGLPREMDFPKTNTMGFLLIITLVKQLKGTVELKRREGTEFVIRFGDWGKGGNTHPRQMVLKFNGN